MTADRKTLLNIVAVFAVLVAALHLTALALALYWRFWWFDMLTHFIGGVFVSMLLPWFFFWSGYTRLSVPSPRVLFLCMVGGTFLVGVGWEVFERLLGFSWSPEGYWQDTITDVCMALVGAVVSVFVFKAQLSRPAVSVPPDTIV